MYLKVNLWAYTPVRLGRSHVLVCHHLLRRRALAPVHLRSDLQGRVDDWVDVVLLARKWVSPALQGQELLRRELELLVSALGDLTA